MSAEEEKSVNLYLVPTPIGNLKDITLRAIEVLKAVDVILAEDTRTTGKLLKYLEINRPLQSYHIFNEHKTVEKLVDRMLKGEMMALCSDAGTPGISDPGFLLVRAAKEAGLEVSCLPGATAFVPALVNSGLPNDRFTFEGFLPHKKGRQTRIQNLIEETRTMVFYESPHRLMKTLQQLAEAFGYDRMASVSRELTKVFEENVRGTLAELISYYEEHPVKGEIVLVVEGTEGRGKRQDRA
ncbi:16S rRNA (cytidine(1402)-2'-O)-methyltransferase [Cecembia lonarensis]|uniref:Ribosomal RNA small subunit methyltransferase I n=1 Tax=Cecembia lonarensis (strain CCUG 58316 / KCTC 22772 / LW9) TaxID=1225176 RepID=K1LAX4_CECL9|nr:16S rRNA (cytidine(1402)-2'-O)-methyltransferase [Cecembia lonarensis]EKB47553.1 Ribosomal RNA small subunit methyltransferase I [Cecembia lonarensis LW9]